MVISHLVAVSNNNVIGKDNDLPWKLKRDLQHFKNYTTGKTIVKSIRSKHVFCFTIVGVILPAIGGNTFRKKHTPGKIRPSCCLI